MHDGSTLLTWPQDSFHQEPSTGIRSLRLPARPPMSLGGGRLPLGQLWTGLVSGQLRLCPDDRAAGLGPAPAHELRVRATACSVAAPRAADVESLSQFLRGEPNKRIAIAASRSPASVSRQHSLCLEAMAVAGVASHAPVLLALAAHAAGGALLEPAAVGWQTEGSVPMLVLYAARIDAGLERRLSCQVLAALRLFIDGLTHRQIAARLGKSQRTVTNQLHAATRKLQAYGRFGVIARLVQLRQGSSKRGW